MPISTRSQTHALKLDLPSTSFVPAPSANTMVSPHTPIPSSPYGLSMLPLRYSLRSLSKRRSSESFASLASEESGLSGMSSLALEPADWQEEHEKLLSKALDSLPDYLTTPYVGNIPPPNLLQNLAKGIAKDMKDREGGWPYALSQTRIKLREIAERKANEMNVGSGTTEQAPGRGKRSLRRSDSMDFLPVNGKDRVAAASRRLQRLDQILEPTFRPPPQPTRSSPRRPSAAAAAEPPQTITISYQTLPRPLIRTRTDMGPYAPSTPTVFEIPAPPPLRRAGSAMAIVDQPGSNPAPLRALKRAPSYGSSTGAPEGRMEAVNPTKRRKTARKTRPPSFLGGPLPGLEGSLPQESAPAVILSPEPVVVPQTPVRRAVATRTRTTPSAPPTVSPRIISPTTGRVRTRSQTKADADATMAAQDALERESQKSAEQDKENTPSISRRSRTTARKKDQPLESPFEEIKRVIA